MNEAHVALNVFMNGPRLLFIQLYNFSLMIFSFLLKITLVYIILNTYNVFLGMSIYFCIFYY